MCKQVLTFVGYIAVLTLSGCSLNTTPAGPDLHESRSVELDKSEKVRAELKIGAGELSVRGNSPKLMDADFTYNVAEWKPDVRYRAGEPAGDLVIEQHGPVNSNGNTKNRWDVRFNNTVPLDLRVQVGAGEAKLNLSSLTLSSVDVEVGAGSLDMDLRGTPKRNYGVHVRGGVGDATVHLPREIGISASASGGLGEISVKGLHKTGDLYVNDAYAGPGVKIRLDVQGGVGSIHLIAE